MKSRNRPAVLALLALIAMPVPKAAFAQSDAVGQARSLRMAGRLDEAERLLGGALARNPGDYMAQYNMGLVYEARAAKLVQTPGPQRVALLRRSADWLEKALATRVRGSIDEYTVYNTLGYVYLQLGDVASADRVLKQGVPFASRLSETSRAKFNANLGYLASLKGQPRAASSYFDKAAKAGNVSAQENKARLTKKQ
jgi:tetratricopeptide (TPR) repeat protein